MSKKKSRSNGANNSSAAEEKMQSPVATGSEVREAVDAKKLQDNFSDAAKVEAPSGKVSKEPAADKFNASKKMEGGKVLTAAAILKENISDTLKMWNKRYMFSALFANLNEAKAARFLEITENLSVYPAKELIEDETAARTEIFGGKTFFFVSVPDSPTVANLVTIYNAVESYQKAKIDAVNNAKENAGKERLAKLKALKLLYNSGTLSAEVYESARASIM